MLMGLLCVVPGVSPGVVWKPLCWRAEIKRSIASVRGLKAGTAATNLPGAVSDGLALAQLSSLVSVTARLRKMEVRESSDLAGCMGKLRLDEEERLRATGESASGLCFIDQPLHLGRRVEGGRRDLLYVKEKND
jgi:hypothetical protein